MYASPHAHLYAQVPVIFWPFLWWQLFRLGLWTEATGRDVLFAVDRYGRVHVRLVADDPSRWTPSVRPHLHQHYLTARLPGENRDQWRGRLAAVYAPGFDVQAWIISPRALGEEVAQFVIPDLTLPPAGPGVRDPVISQILRLSRA